MRDVRPPYLFGLCIFDVFIFYILHLWISNIFFHHSLNWFNNVFLVLFALNIFILGFHYIQMLSPPPPPLLHPKVLKSFIMASISPSKSSNFLIMQSSKFLVTSAKSLSCISNQKAFSPTHILSEKYREHPKTPTNNNTSKCCKIRGQK